VWLCYPVKPEIHAPFGVVLISAPWPLYNRPSVQIGALKSCLTSCFPDISIYTHHAYLQVAESIGYLVYQAISERTWLAEAVYAALLFPEKKTAADRLFQRYASKKTVLKKINFFKLVEDIRTITEKILSGISFQEFHLAGISVCLCQLSASLYFARCIKRQAPKIQVVLGGSSLSGLCGTPLFRFFPEIDFLVHGEGELPLTHIVEHLIQNKERHQPVPPIKGVFQREMFQSTEDVTFDQIPNLRSLSSPDYDDYFALLKALPPENRFFPTLPVEASRGCWWHRKTISPRSRRQGCAFCNLNLQWRGYRCKDPGQAAKEVDHLTRKHRVLSVAFTDNIIPPKLSESLFEELAAHGKDYHFFCELRADTPKDLLERMQRAGVKEVQIGIEALSTPLLNRLNKGTCALQNLEIMKHCEKLGMISISNLILYFPGSDAADVAETLRLLDFAKPFRPLRTVSFWLGRGSPVWEDPASFGIHGAYNHPDYQRLFPKAMAKELPWMVQAYRGDRTHQKRLWRPVKESVKKWKKEYERLYEGSEKDPILSFSDGGEFLIIRQRRPGASPLNHRLEGRSREIYLYCDSVRSIQEILIQFKGLSKEKVARFLELMVGKRLMANEGSRYLSLAISERFRC